MDLHPDVRTTSTDYGTVLLNERSGEYFQLNPTGALVVETLLAGGSAQQAVSALTERFEIGTDQAHRDVDELLESLRQAGLVTP